MKKYNIVFLELAFLLSACETTPPAPTVAPPPSVSAPLPTAKAVFPQQGKTITISMRQPKTLNPVLNEDATVARALRLVYENLITLDEYQKATPNLAESYEFSGDGKSVRVVLREVYWHDGTLLTPQDVTYSIGILKSAPETAYYKNCARNILSSETFSNGVTINFIAPNSSNAFLLDFPIIKNGGALTGNGAFKFEATSDAREWSLVKNENYFKKIPLIDNIRILATTDFETDMNAFAQGITDAIATDVLSAGDFLAVDYSSNDYDFIGFNYQNQIFYDLNFRKAIACAFPKDEILKSSYINAADKALAPYNPNSWFGIANLPEYEYDVSKSKSFLAQTKYDPESAALRILVNSENLERQNAASILSKNLKSAGINSIVVSVPFEEFEANVKAKNFDILAGGFSLSIPPDVSFMLHSKRPDTNIFSYRDEILDQKLDKAAAAPNETALGEALADVQNYIAREIPIISVVFRRKALLTGDTLFGVTGPTESNIYNNVNEWFVFEEDEN
jgi:peptide/nickel transport system substrate-binding protein